jgi:tetratricopeptide (TPR) repeat protein
MSAQLTPLAGNASGGHDKALWRWATPMIALLVAALVVVSTSGSKFGAVARAASGNRSRGAIDPRAKLAYLRGVNAWSDRSEEGLNTAVIYFRSASEIDPGYAEAYAGLADAYVLLGYSGYRPADAMFPKAKAAAMRSMELDSALAAPHAALAHELMWERDFRRSEAEFRKAISLEPGYATAHQWYSMLLMMLGRTQEAVVESGRAAQLDPLSLQIQNTYATFLGASGQREAALRQYEKVVGEEPDSAWVRRNPWLLTNMASVYASNGLYGKAIRAAELAMKIVHNHPRAATTLASIYIRLGQREMARKAFERADTANEQYIAHRGLMYARLGQTDSAFLWLGRVQDWAIPVMIGLRADGQLGSLRRDPRYPALLRRLRLSD